MLTEMGKLTWIFQSIPFLFFITMINFSIFLTTIFFKNLHFLK